MKRKLIPLFLLLCLSMLFASATAFGAFADEGATAIVTEVSTSAELVAAFESDGTVRLKNDVKLTQKLEVRERTITLDLNGYVLSGETITVFGAANDVSTLTLTDSRPGATHSDEALPKGGILTNQLIISRKSNDGNYQKNGFIIPNGGTVTKRVELETGTARIGNQTTFATVFLDGVRGYGKVSGGIYYGEKYLYSYGESAPEIEGRTVTFKEGDKVYATEVVRNGAFSYEPVQPEKDGYCFEGWYNGEQKHNFSSYIYSDTTLTAKWLELNSVSTFADFKSALRSGKSVKLNADINMTENITLSYETFGTSGDSFVPIAIDLNGYVLSGKEAYFNSGIRLFLLDSRPDAIHADGNLPKGGYVSANLRFNRINNTGRIEVFANGGTAKDIGGNSSYATIYCTSDTPTAFTGGFGSYTSLKGGVYYANPNGSRMEKKITYKDGETVYAVQAYETNKLVTPVYPQKKGYSLIWLNGTEEFDFAKRVTENVTLTAKWVVDDTAPTGAINLDGVDYSTVASDVVFDAYMGIKPIYLRASDDYDKEPLIEYLFSDKKLTDAELAAASFTRYEKAFTVDKNGSYVLYARFTDKAGNVAYVSTRGFKWDTKAPVIAGIENGVKYCEAKTVTITDDNLKSVTVNGTPVTLSNGKLTIEPNGDHTVVAIDYADNKTEVSVKGHAYDQKTVDERFLKASATCTAKAVYYKSCTCGACLKTETAETFETGEPTDHKWSVKYDSFTHWEECEDCETTKDSEPHAFADDDAIGCSTEGCEYKRLRSLTFTVDGYGIDESMADFKVVSNESNLGVSSKYFKYGVVTDVEKYLNDMNDPVCRVGEDDFGYFVPRKEYYFYVATIIDGYDIKDFKRNNIKVVGVNGACVLFDTEIDDGLIFMLYRLPTLIGESEIEVMPELEFELEGYGFGLPVGEFKVELASKNVAFGKSEFTLYADGVEVVADAKFGKTSVYSLYLKIYAPENYTFYGYDFSGVTIDGAEVAYTMTSAGGGYIVIGCRLPELEANHAHTDNFGWNPTDDGHFKFCDDCGTYLGFAAHQYENDEDVDCDICGYERTIAVTELEFALSGYETDARATTIKLTVNKGKGIVWSNDYGNIFMLSTSDYQSWYEYIDKQDNGHLLPNKQYYLFVRIWVKANFSIAELKPENIKIAGVGSAKSLNDNYGNPIAVFELPLLEGESQVEKVSGKINISVTGYELGDTVGQASVTFSPNVGVASMKARFSLIGYMLGDNHVFDDTNRYILEVNFYAADGYTFYGVTDEAFVLEDVKLGMIQYEVLAGGGGVSVQYYLISLKGEHEHDYAYGCDEQYHYKYCKICYESAGSEEHTFDEENENYCTVCKNTVPVVIDKVSFTLSGYGYGSAFGELVMTTDCEYLAFNSDYRSDYEIGTNPDWTQTGFMSFSDYFKENTTYYLHVFVVPKDYTKHTVWDLKTKDITIENLGNPITVANRAYAVVATFKLPTLLVPHVHGGEWVECVDSTCTAEGVKGYYECEICKKYFDEMDNELLELKIEKKPHTFGEWIDEVKATAKADGVKGHKDCTECGKHFDINGAEITDLVIPASGSTNTALSGGAIAAISVGGVLVLGIGGFAIVWFVVQKKTFGALIAAIKGVFKKE